VLKLILFSVLFLSFSSPALALTSSKSVRVSASIGENRATIFGYTSPDSLVELTSTAVYGLTYSDSTGYFFFNKTFLPSHSFIDLCLTSTDAHSLTTLPVCFPAPPLGSVHTEYGPILLPPTISLNPNASGQGIPLSPINIYLFQKESSSLFVKPAQAFSLPIFSTVTDSDGNYSLNLPNVYSTSYRLFATVNYQDFPSPKSNTLFYSIPYAFPFWLLIIFLLSLLIFIILLVIYFKRPKVRYLPAIIYQ